jgi:hypothetical protein
MGQDLSLFPGPPEDFINPLSPRPGQDPVEFPRHWTIVLRAERATPWENYPLPLGSSAVACGYYLPLESAEP